MEQKNLSEVPYRDFMLAKYKELYACLSRQVEILERQLRCQNEYIRFLEGRLAGGDGRILSGGGRFIL